MSYDDLAGLLSGSTKLELETAQLRDKLANAQLGDADGSIARRLATSLRDAIKIVQWAIGNYDPETVIGWPHEALNDVAKSILALPGATDIELEWAHDALRFARFAATVDQFRKSGRQKELANIPRSALGGTGYFTTAAQLLMQAPFASPQDAAQNAPQQEAPNGQGQAQPQNEPGPAGPA